MLQIMMTNGKVFNVDADEYIIEDNGTIVLSDYISEKGILIKENVVGIFKEYVLEVQ